jgi:chromosomal replication initiator protein
MAGRRRGQRDAVSEPALPIMTMVAAEVSEDALREAVAQKLGSTRYDLWFGEGTRLGIDGETLAVGVPNPFFREWIQGHFAANLIEAAETLAGRPLRLEFHIDSEAAPRVGHVIEPTNPDGRTPLKVKVPLPSNPGPAPKVEPTPAPPMLPPDRPRMSARAGAKKSAPALAPVGLHSRPVRRLEDFVVGPCNRLAQAAAVEMVASLGESFNPLVIHGGVGLGKTHLLEGVSHAFRSLRPGARLVHVTAEAFTNGFLDALRGTKLPSFRANFRKAEALVVDDAHFLAAKRATQDEFLHTFNALIADGVPIILAADQHPRMIARLTDELATRFLGGMVVKLDTPDPSTRKAILKAKAIARGVDVPDAVIAYVAENLRASVRELEGALHSLIAHAVLTGRRLDLNLAKAALRDTIRHTATAVALKDVERAVCQLFSVDAETLKSDGRARALSYPRMLAMYLARKHTGCAYSEIGRFFGGRNHSTVISAEKKVLAWLKADDQCHPLAGFETVADVLGSLERALGA